MIRTLLVIFALQWSMLMRGQEECIDPDFEYNCTDGLTSIFDDYLYLKSRAFTSKENIDVVFSVTLKRDVLYIFNVCQQKNNNSMIIELYNSKNELVASSYNKKTKKNDKIITFSTANSGKFYISTFFEKKEASCCLIMFGMIKKNIEQYVRN